jgi:hypothetical protein
MKRDIVWHYRKLLFALAYAKWLMFREKQKYHDGLRVIVRFRSAIYGTEEVLCRIREANYRFYNLTYEVIVLEDKEWLPFGTKTFVFSDNILRKHQAND